TSISAQYAGAYFDRDIDAVTKPDMPVPSGRISAGSALAGMVGSIVMAFTLAALLNPVNLVFVPLALLLGGAYGRFLKPRRALRVFARGVATIAAFGIGTLTTAGMPLWDLIFLSLIFWQQDSMYHLVGAIGDTEADRRAGRMTFPVRFGHRAALWLFVVMLVC